LGAFFGAKEFSVVGYEAVVIEEKLLAFRAFYDIGGIYFIPSEHKV